MFLFFCYYIIGDRKMEKVIICLTIAIIALVIIMLINIYNKLQYSLIKLDKADTNIEDALNKKYQILLRFIDFLNDNIKVNKEVFNDFYEINLKSINNIKLSVKIDECYHEIKMYLDDHEKLLKNETLIGINKELREVDIVINSCKKYYNNNLVTYNKLVKCFPSKLIAKIYKYKEKDFYPENKEDSLKILEKE